MYVCSHAGAVYKIPILPSVRQMVEWRNWNIRKGRGRSHVYFVSFADSAVFKKTKPYLAGNLLSLHAGADRQ